MSAESRVGTTAPDVSIAAAVLLQAWLNTRLDEVSAEWLTGQLDAVMKSNSARERHIAFGLIPRKLGRTELNLTAEEAAAAECVCHGWILDGWTVDAAARVLILCRLAERDAEGFGEIFEDLCRNADLSESMTLLRAISILPWSPRLDAQVAEGLRTNMRVVFEAIAHRNPYPWRHFDTNRWNHLVLKALFVESPLWPIQGLDARANDDLATILCDYAHERWAAKRRVSPELWRCVGPFARGAQIDDLQRVLDTGDDVERDAALLALAASPDDAAAGLLSARIDAKARMADGRLDWVTVSRRLAGASG